MKHKMRSLIFLFVATIAMQTAMAKDGGDHGAIRAALGKWNDAAGRADLDTLMTFFDDSGNVILAGSDHGEIYRGKKDIRAWLATLLAHRRFSWDLSHPDIDQNGDTAWVFVDGTMTVTDDGGTASSTPYRFSGVLVKRGNDWKWRLFDGSIPAGE